MKPSDTTKLPKKTSAKVNDPDNPAWTEDMLGEPVLKRVKQVQEEVLSSTEKENGQPLQFPIENVPNEATAKSLLLSDEQKEYKLFEVTQNSK